MQNPICFWKITIKKRGLSMAICRFPGVQVVHNLTYNDTNHMLDHNVHTCMCTNVREYVKMVVGTLVQP